MVWMQQCVFLWERSTDASFSSPRLRCPQDGGDGASVASGEGDPDDPALYVDTDPAHADPAAHADATQSFPSPQRKGRAELGMSNKDLIKKLRRDAARATVGSAGGANSRGRSFSPNKSSSFTRSGSAAAGAPGTRDDDDDEDGGGSDEGSRDRFGNPRMPTAAEVLATEVSVPRIYTLAPPHPSHCRTYHHPLTTPPPSHPHHRYQVGFMKNCALCERQFPSRSMGNKVR